MNIYVQLIVVAEGFRENTRWCSKEETRIKSSAVLTSIHHGYIFDNFVPSLI